MKLTHPLAVLGLLALCAPAPAADFNEVEPNDTFPPAAALGPFAIGDRLIGAIDPSDDFDLEYLNVTGPGAAGIYRYTFDLETGGGDSILTLFDGSANGFILGSNDDFPGKGFASRVNFDHFDPTGASLNWGVAVESFFGFDSFDYALTVSRAATPVVGLGSVSGSSTLLGLTDPGLANWYSFTLENGALTLDIDTNNSPLDSFGFEPDTEIALFDSAGNTLIGDDDGGVGFQSLVSLTDLAAGTYYVAVGPFNSTYNYDPFSGGPFLDRNGFGTNSTASQAFRLNFAVTAVPEPGAMALLAGGGVFGLGLAARRRARR